MSMRGYFDIFPEKTTTELRTATFTNDDPLDSLVGGTFVFTEYFCTDPECDCQRVLVKVFRADSEDSRPEEVATISYSWEPNGDEVWSMLNSDMPNPFLDPFHRQASYASELLDFWDAMIARDRAYASRIERHYDEIRTEVAEAAEKWDQPSTSREVSPSLGRSRTKRERKARKRRLARTRKRK